MPRICESLLDTLVSLIHGNLGYKNPILSGFRWAILRIREDAYGR